MHKHYTAYHLQCCQMKIGENRKQQLKKSPTELEFSLISREFARIAFLLPNENVKRPQKRRPVLSIWQH